MVPETPSRRFAARLALVASPVLAAGSVLTQPDLSGSAQHQLATIGTAPLAPLSAALFAVSQLAFLVAVTVIGRLVLPAAPRLSAWGTTLAVLGAFAHAVYGGVMLVVVAMGRDAAHRDAYAGLLDRMQSSPLMLFAMVGLIGTVLGLLLLGVALLRSQVGPRWVGPALCAFVVVEFAGGALSSSASYVSTVLLLAAFLPLLPLLAPRAPAPVTAGTPAMAGM